MHKKPDDSVMGEPAAHLHGSEEAAAADQQCARAGSPPPQQQPERSQQFPPANSPRHRQGGSGWPPVWKETGMSCFKRGSRCSDRLDGGNRWQRHEPKVIARRCHRRWV
ncbi:unnamed protein product [Lota lota]